MKLLYSIFFTISSLSVFGQYSSIIDFPVSTVEYMGDPIVVGNIDTVFNLKVYYSIPENPVGIIYFFHGGGGSGRTWLLNVEQPYLLVEAVSRGYGIVTMDSNNRHGNRWEIKEDDNGNKIPQDDTYDTEHVWWVHQNLLNAGMYDESTPLFATGFSNGGAFTSALGLRASSYFIENEAVLPNVNNIVPFNAIAIYGALGYYTRPSNFDTPTIFNVGYNDNRVAPYPDMTWHDDWPYGPEETVEFSYNNLISKGIDAEFNVKPEETANPYIFEIIPGIDSLGSNSIYESVKVAPHPANGLPFISAEDSILVNPGTNGFWKPYIPSMYQNKTPKIEQQLNVKYSGHVVFREFRDETLDFFDENLVISSTEDDIKKNKPKLNLKSYPMPFEDQVNISYDIGKTCDLDILIYDNEGRIVYQYLNQFHTFGSYHFVWQPGQNSKGIPKGVYHLVLRTQDWMEQLKLIKL